MKKIIITGSSSGIGFNAAKKLHDLNYDIVGIDFQTNIALPKGIKQYKCDLLNDEQVKSIFSEINSFDIAINCAGVIGIRKNILEFSTDDFKKCFDSVFFPTFNAMKEELKIINKNHSSGKVFKIINVGSITAKYGARNTAAYSTAKAALVNLTKVAAVENAPYVHVNSISPATIDTPMIRNKHKNNWPDYSNSYLTADCGSVDDVFHAIYMLIENNFMTGYDLVLDGGYGCVFELKLE